MGTSIGIFSNRSWLLIWITIMLSIFILTISTIALIYMLVQLVKAKQQGKFLQTLRDLLIITLAILMTFAIFYIGYRVLRAF